MAPPENSATELPPDLPTVAGYVLQREIGRGSYAVVYLAREEGSGRAVAVKLLTRNSGRDESTTQTRFQREARLLADMSDPGIVEFLGTGKASDGTDYIVMEYVEGRNLREWIESNGPIAERDGVLLLKALARALMHAHERGIIHRDVKPENIILDTADGERLSDSFPVCAKVADLGLGRYETSNGEISITMKGAILGTPSVMAPEQFHESGEVDHRTDIYALGSVIFFALAGKHAFAKGSVPEIVLRKTTGPAPRLSAALPATSPSLDGFLARMMAPKQDARIQDYSRILSFCDDYLAERASPPSEVAVPVEEVEPPSAAAAPEPSPAPEESPAAVEATTPPSVGKGSGCMGVIVLATGLGLAVLLAAIHLG